METCYKRRLGFRISNLLMCQIDFTWNLCSATNVYKDVAVNADYNR